eukprot:1179047-Prorocentrum_minimum.AAC.2
MGIFPTREPITAQPWVYTYIPAPPAPPRVQGANRSAGMGILPTLEPITVQLWAYTCTSSTSAALPPAPP